MMDSATVSKLSHVRMWRTNSGYLMLGVVEDSLNQGLKGRIVGFEVVDIFLVQRLSDDDRIGIVDTFGAIDRGTGSATRGVSIALISDDRISGY